MKKIQMPVAKKAIQELSGDQLDAIVKFGKSKEFQILKLLSDREKYLRYQSDFLNANSIEDINFYKGINVGIDYILDVVNRAKEELKNRGVKDAFDIE
jgi:hypothetical protein